jgi:tetratricopeptide (TPR) repeat protein
LLALVAAGIAAGWFWYGSRHDRKSAFLPGYGKASWIVYPSSPRTGVRGAFELDGRFERSFQLQEVPRDARLRFRAFRRCDLSVNGREVPVSTASAGSWKSEQAVDVAEYLQAGENRIVATVFNHRGPPALWLSLETAKGSIVTDAGWEVSLAGATRDRARLASDPADPVETDPDVARASPPKAFRSRWGTLALTALVAALSVFGLSWCVDRLKARPGANPERTEWWLVNGMVALMAMLWAVLVVNNAPSLWPLDGFDADGHLEYVQFILDHGSLPSADQGWSMFQPPLYYVISAGLLKLGGLATSDLGGAYLLRLQSLLFGIAQLFLLLAGLRLVFPGETRKQVIGMTVAAAVPMHLYMYQFVGNDALAATLASAAVLLGLRIVREGSFSPRSHAALGACLGAAMLAKFSVAIVVLVLAVTLAWKLALERRGILDWLRSLGVGSISFLVVCGWHFGAVWYRFGSPFVGNWDPSVIPAWWQDPGYLTSSYYLRFGESLATPILSAYHSFADGIYSTLWGDGLISGRSQVWFAPPWDLEWMAAGYLLAIVPSVFILVGAIGGLVRWIARPAGVWFVLVGLGAATGFALVVWPLRIPIYSVIKAPFGMPAMLSLCAFATLGFDLLVRRWAPIRWLALVALLTWALSAYSSFWIPRGDATAQARVGWLNAGVSGREELAEGQLTAALESDPGNAAARLGMAKLLRRLGRPVDAERQLRELLVVHPDHVRGHLKLADLLESQGRPEQAGRHYRQALDASPRHPVAHYGAARLPETGASPQVVVAHLREVLRTAPEWGDVHYRLGLSLLESGEIVQALAHLRRAVRLEPNRPEPLERLAWIVATLPDRERDEQVEAVRLAERAAGLTGYRNPAILDTLAAAYAAEGEFARAVSTAEAALGLASDSGDEALESEIRLRLELYRRGRPFRTGK